MSANSVIEKSFYVLNDATILMAKIIEDDSEEGGE
jgi:hypothetical protein